MKIVVDDLSGPKIAAFLDEHVQQMRAITPLESKYALDLDALRTPDLTFWSVLDDDKDDDKVVAVREVPLRLLRALRRPEPDPLLTTHFPAFRPLSFLAQSTRDSLSGLVIE